LSSSQQRTFLSRPANELTHGLKDLDEALEGAARFASGEGRHGSFA
jgi:hypothetical protein